MRATLIVSVSASTTVRVTKTSIHVLIVVYSSSHPYDFEQTINSGNLCLTHYRFLLDPRWSSTKSSPSVCAWHVSLVNWTRFENGRLTGSSLSLINAD